MKIEMFRKRETPSSFVVDNIAEIVFENVFNIRVTQNCIFFEKDGESRKISIDDYNYLYIVS